jgi:hypothetical protein
MNDLRQLFINIIRQFMDVLQKNKLLGLECMFRFTSREHKDSILNNYEGMQSAPTAALTVPENQKLDAYDDDDLYQNNRQD